MPKDAVKGAALGSNGGREVSRRSRLRLWHGFIFAITGYFRGKRGKYLLGLFPGIRAMKICDLGGSRHFWDNLGIDVPRQNISIYNISESETENLSGENDDGSRFFIYDGLHLPVEDNHFDLLVCNSVLEHVPPPARAALAGEMMRVSRRIFCQTPAYSFPVEPHFVLPFIHWLPERAAYYFLYLSPWKLLARPAREKMNEYLHGTRLLKEKELRGLFPGCDIEYERFFGLAKSYFVVRK